MHPWLSLLQLVHLDCRTLALVSSLSKLLLKEHVHNKPLLHYRSVYKMEPASLESAEIRFLSSWLFFYLSVSLRTRLIHTYDLCKSDCYFGTQLILIYMVKFSWVYTPLISALKIFGFICYQIFSYGFDLGNLCCMWSLFHFCEKKKILSFSQL